MSIDNIDNNAEFLLWIVLFLAGLFALGALLTWAVRYIEDLIGDGRKSGRRT